MTCLKQHNDQLLIYLRSGGDRILLNFLVHSMNKIQVIFYGIPHVIFVPSKSALNSIIEIFKENNTDIVQKLNVMLGVRQHICAC